MDRGAPVEASKKYCEITGALNKPMLTFVLWFILQKPELKDQLEKDCITNRADIGPLQLIQRLTTGGRWRFFQALN